MRDCKKCRVLLAEALYGDLDPEQRTFFENHIASCPACAAEFKALTETLKTMDKRVRPEPGQDFWNGYWDRLSQRMEEERVGQEFINAYPESEWADDARSNMVRLGRDLARHGRPEYEAKIQAMEEGQETDVRLAALYASRTSETPSH